MKKKPEIIISETHQIDGDKTMVTQVFANLIGNAVKYSMKAEFPVITISSEEKGGKTIFTISDNGIGVAPADQQHIFELFTPSPKAKDYEGTGVGLSIVKKIMDRHNGRIWLQSDGKNGSQFFVAFKNHMDYTENSNVSHRLDAGLK